MSRIARIPVVLASGVDCKITADSVTLKGKVGEVSTHILPLVEIKQDGNTLHFSAKDESRESNQNSGTMTALVRCFCWLYQDSDAGWRGLSCPGSGSEA